MIHTGVIMWWFRRGEAFEFDTTMSLGHIEAVLRRMETIMSAEVDALNEIKTRLADIHDDVKARLDVVAGELSEEGKSEVEAIKSALDSFDAEIGDADGSETPPVDEPADPLPTDPSVPVENGAPPSI